MTIKALIVQPDGSAQIREIGEGWQDIKAEVGGWLEAVGGELGNWTAYADEEGRLKGLEPNTKATALIRHLQPDMANLIVGPVVFVGSKFISDEDGYGEADLPESLEETARWMFDV